MATDHTSYDLYPVQQMILKRFPQRPQADYDQLEIWAKSRLQQYKERGNISLGELKAITAKLEEEFIDAGKDGKHAALKSRHNEVKKAFRYAVDHIDELTPREVGRSAPTRIHNFAPARPRTIVPTRSASFFMSGGQRRETASPRLHPKPVEPQRTQPIGASAPARPVSTHSPAQTPAPASPPSYDLSKVNYDSPLPKPADFMFISHARKALGVSPANQHIAKPWGILEDLASQQKKGADRTVKVTTDHGTATMGWFRSGPQTGWALKTSDVPILKGLYDDNLPKREPKIKESKYRGVEWTEGYSTKSQLVIAVRTNYHHDPEFEPMWNALVAAAEAQPRSEASKYEVEFEGRKIEMAYMHRGKSTGWYIADASIPEVRSYLDTCRADRKANKAHETPTNQVTEAVMLGQLDLCKAAGAYWRHTGFQSAWAQMVEHASDLPVGEHMTLHTRGGMVKVQTASRGEKRGAYSMDKNGVPVFTRAMQRAGFMESVRSHSERKDGELAYFAPSPIAGMRWISSASSTSWPAMPPNGWAFPPPAPR